MRRLRKAELEARARDAVIRFKKDFLRRGPKETRAYLTGDHLLVCSRDNLTPAEAALAEGGGAELLRQLYRQQIAHGRERLRAALEAALGLAVRTIHADFCPHTGEAVLVVTLEGRADAGAEPPAGNGEGGAAGK